MQKLIHIYDSDYTPITEYLLEHQVHTLLLVCDSAIKFLKYDDYFRSLEEQFHIIRFDDFEPNPGASSVEKGVKVFRENSCDMIFAIGGGSAIDVAKCIKLLSNMDTGKSFFEQTIVPNDIPLAALPTTAGTGSEATRYAVVYYKGSKQSVTDDSCIPNAVFLDSTVLETLPKYQKKSTMLDALCHAIESFWSVNSTDESKEYSKQAIKLILDNIDGYLSNTKSGNENMMIAANIAGKAINITQTTAGHAMCYKLTGMYGIAHGHAAAICVSKLWTYMLDHTDKCIDLRGEEYLRSIFDEIAAAMGGKTAEEAVDRFDELLEKLSITAPKTVSKDDFDILAQSVNPVRLKNNPVELDLTAINEIYHAILE